MGQMLQRIRKRTEDKCYFRVCSSFLICTVSCISSIKSLEIIGRSNICTLSSSDFLPECTKEKEPYRNFSSPGVGTKSSHRIMAFLEHLTGWEGWDILAKTVHNTKNQLLFVWYQLTSKAMKNRNQANKFINQFCTKKKDQNYPMIVPHLHMELLKFVKGLCSIVDIHTSAMRYLRPERLTFK